MLKIAICDDDQISLAFIKRILISYAKNTDTTLHVDMFQHGDDLLNATKTQHYHIHILDIMMPEMDGIELAKQIRKDDTDAFLIFLTSSDEYTKDAYQVDAINYLMKPVSPGKLAAILTRIISFLPKEEPRAILVQTKKGLVKLPVDQIVYVEHIAHVIHFHLADGGELASLTSTLTLSDVADQLLQSPNYLQPHRAYIVNMDYIHTLTKTDIILKNNQGIPIPCRRYVAVRNQYTEYIKQA
ncbi:MAG: LytTR family DNA-binding domain-containing protein [bacterium]|nr:LytTR family DNA-binding domain-containing protein [bacterium]